jgi:hypothetical protein
MQGTLKRVVPLRAIPDSITSTFSYGVFCDKRGCGRAGWGVPGQPPRHFYPGRPEPPSLPGGEVGSEPPPSRKATAGRYPFLSGRGKSPHRRYFFVKEQAIVRVPLPGSHFWGGGFPANPPARYCSGQADPPPPMVGG